MKQDGGVPLGSALSLRSHSHVNRNYGFKWGYCHISKRRGQGPGGKKRSEWWNERTIQRFKETNQDNKTIKVQQACALLVIIRVVMSRRKQLSLFRVFASAQRLCDGEGCNRKRLLFILCPWYYLIFHYGHMLL